MHIVYSIYILIMYLTRNERMNEQIKKEIIELGGKEWSNHGKNRVYMTCEIFNKVTKSACRLNDSKNKFFYDLDQNAILRSYKGKKATVEHQYK